MPPFLRGKFRRWPLAANAALVGVYAALMLMTGSVDPASALYERYQADQRRRLFSEKSAAYRQQVQRLRDRAAIDHALRGWSQRQVSGNGCFWGCMLSEENMWRIYNQFRGCHTVIYRLRNEAEVRVVYDKAGRCLSSCTPG